jgi:sugar/nucleoside kinase (ribokinase family)
MRTGYDILGLGAVAVDDFLFVKAYPPADSKVRISTRERQCGGLTGTALVAAARLGATCAYAGILGNDDLSAFIRSALEKEGVDVRHVVTRGDSVPIYAIIVVDETHHTRTIFLDFSGESGADATLPPEDVIRSAKVLIVDPHGMEGMIRAARIVRAAPRVSHVVADLEFSTSPRFGELLALVDHLILPIAFARELTGKSDPVSVVKALDREDTDTVAVTWGKQGVWYMSKESPGEVRRQEAFIVETVDTTGCGDVFHGAYASALARGLPAQERIRLASAAAAIKATQPGGQRGIPTLPVVEAFLAQRVS